MRVGIGYDVHKFEEGRKLIIGGVDIRYERGLAGHSDADVLIHAIIDAICGALCIGDIGSLFPDTDNAYKDIDSMILLGKLKDKLKENNYKIGNIDVRDMFNTFNMGVGMTIIVDKDDVNKSLEILKNNGENAYVIGQIIKGEQKVKLI